MKRFCFPGMLILVLLVGLAVTGCKKKEINGESQEPAATEQGKTGDEEGEAVEKEEEESEAEEHEAEEEGEAESEEDEESHEAGDEGSIPEDKADLVLKMPKATMPPVKFAHLKHSDEYQVACKTCHHAEGESEDCMSCHGAKKGPDGEPSFKDAMHKACTGCHKEEKKGPTVCNKCHK